jgi:hypothetical protein
VHFHDWELVDRRRRAAIVTLLRLLGRRRPSLTVEQLAAKAAAAPEVTFAEATIAR